MLPGLARYGSKSRFPTVGCVITCRHHLKFYGSGMVMKKLSVLLLLSLTLLACTRADKEPDAGLDAGLEAYEQGDYRTAYMLIRKAAVRGDAEAQYTLGLFYSEGEAVKPDYSQAAYWFAKAAEQGRADAIGALGALYYEGNGVPLDIRLALKLFRTAAEQGDANAQCNLGVMYENGEGVEQDYAEAIKWYRKAAVQGDEDAQEYLKILTEKKTVTI